MPRSKILFAALPLFLFAAEAHAFTGHAGPGVAMADYDPLTGQISVSINGVNNWFIESLSAGLTGDDTSNLPTIPGGLYVDTDALIQEVGFAVSSATDVSLGNVAALGLPLGDLTLTWNAGLGSGPFFQPLSYIFNPIGMTNYQPIAGLEEPTTIDIASDPLNITFDATSTTDDGNNAPLIYEWDLNNDGTYEVSTGTSATLDIADVTATFGGVGDYPVAVRVFDGEFYSGRSRSLSLVNIPEPSTLLLAALATLGLLRRPAVRNLPKYQHDALASESH